MKKELKFVCWYCDNIFKTREWWTEVIKDDPHDFSYITIETKCPKCGRYSNINISLSKIVELVFELEEKVKQLEKKVRNK